jgi:hypothetical protein
LKSRLPNFLLLPIKFFSFSFHSPLSSKKESVLPFRFSYSTFTLNNHFSNTFNFLYICAIKGEALLIPSPTSERRQASFLSLISTLFSLYQQNMYCWVIRKNVFRKFWSLKQRKHGSEFQSTFGLILAFFSVSVGFVVGRSTA